MAVRKLHCLEIHVEGGSQVILENLMSHNLSLNPQVTKEVTAGEYAPTMVAVNRRRPLWDFEGFCLKKIIDNLGARGLCITSGVNPGLRGYLEKFDDCGASASGSVHRSFQVSSALAIPTQLVCNNGEDARLSFQVVVLKKSGSDSVIISDTAALLTVPFAQDRWTLGKMVVGGYTLGDKTNLTLNFGNTVEPYEANSDIEATMIGVRRTEPEIQITGVDQEWFAAANIPLDGVAATQAGDGIYLRKRLADGTGFELDATAVHIKLTFAGLALITNGAQGQSQDVQETALTVHCAKDSGGNDPFVFNTAIAIT